MFKMSRICAAVAGLVIGGAANAVVIDLFDVLQDELTVSGGSAATNQWSQVGSVGEPTIFGGFRDLGIGFLNPNQTSSSGNATIGVVEGINVGAGNRFLSFSNDTGVAATGVVRWDGNTAGSGTMASAFAGPAGGLSQSSINETGTGGLFFGDPLGGFFEILVVSSDLGFEFTLEIFTSDTQWSSISLTAAALSQNFPGTLDTNIPLAAFLDCSNVIPFPVTRCGSGGAVDFNNVGAFQFIINSTGQEVDVDLRLNSIGTAIPEPGSLALVGLGLLGAAGVGMRRRRA
jgi:PEP-CTERM motif